MTNIRNLFSQMKQGIFPLENKKITWRRIEALDEQTPTTTVEHCQS
jgi:hypothetical protein